MASKKKKEKKAAAALKAEAPKKLGKPPGDGKIKKELRRVFGKKLKPEFEMNDEDATIVFFGVKKVGEETARRMIMQLLEGRPSAPA